MTAIFLLYRWQRKKFERQRETYEEEQRRLQYLHQLELEKNDKEIVKLRNEKLEAEIQLQNTEMASASMHLVKKGELIAKMKEELLRLSKSPENENAQEALKRLIKTLGEEERIDKDWDHFPFILTKSIAVS